MGSRNFLSFCSRTYFSLLSTTTRVNTVNMVELSRVEYAILHTMIGEWRVSMIDSSSKLSAQLYHACARLAVLLQDATRDQVYRL